jgi:DNA-binding PadR family transcriptional regulator
MSVGKRSAIARSGRENDPTVLILTSLASGPKHGYALLLDIEDFADVRLGPGTLYGAISRLEDRGLIEAIAAAGRTQPYQLTAAGATALRAKLAELRAIVEEGRARLGLPTPSNNASNPSVA